MGALYANVEPEFSWECDDGVMANWYADHICMGNKIGMPITGYVGKTNEVGLYGMVVDNKVFHFVCGGQILNMPEPRKTEIWGKEYLDLFYRVYNNGLNDSEIEELLLMVKPHKDSWRIWDCKKKEISVFEKL